MIIKAKAPRKKCVTEQVRTLTLEALSPDEFRLLSALHQCAHSGDWPPSLIIQAVEKAAPPPAPLHLKQGEVRTTNLGSGAVTLVELSNIPKQPRPRITILNPSWYDETTGHTQPANSLEVIDPRKLYDFLKNYYEQLPT